MDGSSGAVWGHLGCSRPLPDHFRHHSGPAGETKIVLDCEFEKIQNILKQAKEIELTSDYHAYIFTNLDTERLELGDYIYDNFNVTGFRIVDTSVPDVSEYVKY